MKFRNAIISAVIASTAIFSNASAFAKEMTGKEVSAFFSAGKVKFAAGSIGAFKSDGSYSFQHGSSREKGSYVINADGSVSYTKAGRRKPDVFYIDVVKGRKTVVYTSGRYSGKKFRLR